MVDIFRLSIADQRDQIIFGEYYNPKKYLGGLRRFDNLSLEQIEQLDELEILEMNDRQNNAPSIGEMIDFLRERETDGWCIHGYCISPDRPDFRISFEGVAKKTPPNCQDVIDFSMMFRLADEFNANQDGLRCWYD